MARRGSHAVVCLPDAHFPEHDPEAMAVALAAIRRIKPRRVVILGDWLEAAAFSRHPRNKIGEAAADFETELRLCNAAIDEIQKHSREVVFIEGNHEARVEKHAANGDGAHRAAFEAINPRLRISAGRRGFTWIPYFGDGVQRYEIAPDLWAIHGWSTAKSAAERHAQAMNGRSVIYGHTHRMDFDVKYTPGGRLQYSMSPGCLRTLQPAWTTSPTNWAHGFALIYCRNDLTSWTPYPVPIVRGSCILPDGTQVAA